MRESEEKSAIEGTGELTHRDRQVVLMAHSEKKAMVLYTRQLTKKTFRSRNMNSKKNQRQNCPLIPSGTTTNR
jgi:hypothetical protein